MSAASSALLILVMVLLLSYFDGTHVARIVAVLGAPVRYLGVHAHSTHGTSVIRLYTLSLELFDNLCSNMRKNLIYV